MKSGSSCAIGHHPSEATALPLFIDIWPNKFQPHPGCCPMTKVFDFIGFVYDLYRIFFIGFL